MGQPKEARLTPEVAQQICERTASAMVLEGSIARLGSQYVLGLRARNCNTGDILDQEQIQAARREDVLNSLSEIARKLRTRLGESRATVEKHSTPLADATTPSLEALKAYSTGPEGDPVLRLCGDHSLFPPCCRNRSSIRHGPRESGAYLQRDGRVCAVGAEHHKSLGTAGSSQRPGEVFHRLFLRPACDGKSGKGVPDPRVVASDLSSRGSRQMPRGCWEAFPPMGQAGMKEPSRRPGRRSRPTPISCLRTTILPPAIFFSTASPKPRALCSKLPNARSRNRMFW